MNMTNEKMLIIMLVCLVISLSVIQIQAAKVEHLQNQVEMLQLLIDYK